MVLWMKAYNKVKHGGRDSVCSTVEEPVDDYNVLLIGPYPGKIGGVSIFISRLHKASISGIETFVLNTQNFSIFSEKVFSLVHFLWLLPMMNLVHINVSNLTACLLFCLLSRLLNKKIIVQFNSVRYKIKGIKKLELKLILNLSNGVIAVNKKIRKEFLKNFPNAQNKIYVIPPFIKPSLNCLGPLPEEILNRKGKESNLIVANASKIVFHNKSDLYGLGISIDMFNKLALHFPEAVFVFVVSVPTEEMSKIVLEHRMHENFLLYDRPVDFISLLKISDLFVRPTFSDGDSLSVREALSVGIPTIASNVVERPESVILFDINNPGDYLNKVTDVLKNINFYRKRFTEVANKQKDYVNDIKKLYFEILSKKYFFSKKEHKK